MQKSLSITVHPSALGGEYLTVSDAMRQVLDFVEALERIEGADASSQKIIWRLTEAHTNSPPFTVTLSAFSSDPVVSVAIEAERVASLFVAGIDSLLHGTVPDWLDSDLSAPLKRAFKRNMNGVGQTEIDVDGIDALSVVPATAQAALTGLERIVSDEREAGLALRRTEHGAIEADVIGITRWNDKPALIIQERLSGDRLTCVLTDELALELGPAHRWNEAWDSGRVLISGALHYDDDGSLKRVNAERLEARPYTEVSLADLREIDLLRGRTVAEHIRRIRSGEVG